MSVHSLVLAFAHILRLPPLLCCWSALLFISWAINFLHICLISSTYPRGQRPRRGLSTVPYVTGTWYLLIWRAGLHEDSRPSIWDSDISEVFLCCFFPLKSLENPSWGMLAEGESLGGRCAHPGEQRWATLCNRAERFCSASLLEQMRTSREWWRNAAFSAHSFS